MATNVVCILKNYQFLTVAYPISCSGGYFIAIKEVSLLDQGEVGRQSVFQLEQVIKTCFSYNFNILVCSYVMIFLIGFVIIYLMLDSF